MGDFGEWLSENYIYLLAIIIGVASFLLLIVPFVRTLDNVPPISVTYDVFFNSLMTNAVHNDGQYRTYPAYRAFGKTDAMIADPPLVFSIPASVSMLSVVPVYPVFVILLAFFQVFTCLAVFVLVKKYFNGSIAIFTLAIAAIPATFAWLFQYFIGFTSSLESFAFAPFILFFVLYLIEKPSKSLAVLTGAALSIQFMIHGPVECAYIFLFASVIMGYSWLRKRSTPLIISWVIILVSTIVLSLYQFLILRLIRLSNEGLTSTLFGGSPVPDYFPKPDVHWIFIVLAVIGVLIIIQKIWSRKFSDNKLYISAFILFMVLVTMSNLVGVDGSRSMRQLYNGYPFFVILPAIGIYSIFQFIKSKISKNGMIVINSIIVLLIVILSFQPTYAQLNSLRAGESATTSRWQSLDWIAKNTPESAKVFYLYGFEAEFETFGERIPFKGDMGLGFTQTNMVQLCQQVYPEKFAGQWGSSLLTKQETDGVYYYPVRKGMLTFEFQPLHSPGSDELLKSKEQNVTLLSFDYVVAQYKGTQADPCIAFFLNQSIERGHKVVWFNDQYAIMEVNHEKAS